MTSFQIELDDYEITNLRAALEATGQGTWHESMRDPFVPDNPLGVLNNGDWVGQILGKLPVVSAIPNNTANGLAEQARAWIAREKHGKDKL